MNDLATTKYVLRGSTGYLMIIDGGPAERVTVTTKLLNARLFDSQRAAEGYSNKLEGKWEAVRVSHRVSVELMEKGYGDTAIGDPYPKHLDML